MILARVFYFWMVFQGLVVGEVGKMGEPDDGTPDVLASIGY